MNAQHNSISLVRLVSLLALAFVSSALAVDPPPGGGYPGMNTALGEDALFSLTTGTFNSGIGYQALYSDTTGSLNTALGTLALTSNTSGLENTALGYKALTSNIGGFANTAVGIFALGDNIHGDFNVAIGYSALGQAPVGNDNVAIGPEAMEFSEGSLNVAVGLFALQNVEGQHNVGVGAWALRSVKGSDNIAVGPMAGGNVLDGHDNILIGNEGERYDVGGIRIGTERKQNHTFIAGISGATVADGVGVVIGSNGKLGTVTSSARFKEQIEPMNQASEALFDLQPVTFRYRHDLDPKGIPQFGLVAEEVAKINPDLVARNEQGDPYTVRYNSINAMLLNEFLKEHRRVTEQAGEIAELKRTVADLQKALREEAQLLQEVRAEVRQNQSTLRLAEN